MFIVKRNADTERNVWQGKNIAFNGRVLGEEALTECSIELQNLKISTNVK